LELHASQLALPALALNEPAGQATHAVYSPLKPGAHLQAAIEVLAGGEVEWRGHAEHPGSRSIVSSFSLLSACEANRKSSSDKW
jgi:hypothetical protein